MLVALIGVLGLVVTAVGSYVVARRTTSGRINTTDAATLWAESQQMRRELRDEVIARREEATRLAEENGRMRERIAVLESEVQALRAQILRGEGES